MAIFVTIIIAFTTTLFLAYTAHAVQSTNRTISFQGRLQTKEGAVVADGNYNVQFKIYQGGDGTAVGNPNGTLNWTETHANTTETEGIQVKNGYFSVKLGSITPFGTSVDWNSDTLYLSMNIAGSQANCESFGTAPCEADGEMLPMKQLTATPYAINSGAVGGKTADNLVQIAQGVQTDASLNTSSIHLNKTGTGNLIQLQNAGNDVFSVTNSGDIEFGNGSSRSIYVADAPTDTAGDLLSIQAGQGGSGSGSDGGALSLQGGNAGGDNGNGGDITINAGSGTGTGQNGSVAIGTASTDTIQIGSTDMASGAQNINIGTNNTSGSTTNIAIGSGGNAAGGTTSISSKDETSVSTNGTKRATFSADENKLYLGNADKNGEAATANDFAIQGTSSTTSGVQGGSLTLQAGAATAGDANGGNIVISGGSGSGSGASGLVVLSTPTFDTVTDDANCYTGGASVASSCTLEASSVNNSSAVKVGFSTTDQTATLPDPANRTAGRIFYVTAANGSETFTLKANVGAGSTIEQNITVTQNTTTVLLWNGDDWTPTDKASEERNSFNDGNASEANLFTLDQSDTAPTISDDALLGSMYYDTEIGKVQCYEASGWGSCGASPDSFITLSPEYTNAVMNGTDVGTISSDICSDELNLNDGSSGQPTVCGTDETHNYYNWTSEETDEQTRSIYITYQLPESFKEFVPGSTSLTARTDSDNAAVSYQMYRDTGENGLASCGSVIPVSTGTQTSWQTATTEGTVDPASCGFSAGDSILIRINLSAHSNTNAYVSDLNFAFSNN